MATVNDVFEVLKSAGEALKRDLWDEENDTRFLMGRATDLIGLHAKILKTEDPLMRERYQLAADMVIDHVKMVALVRLHIAQKKAVDEAGKIFLEKVLPFLGKLLIGLIA